MTRPISDLDVPLPTVQASVDKLRWLLAHPEAATSGKPATPGEVAEQHHLLYDADTDATTPAFPYPNTQEAP